jgi:hypothetical protein
MRQRPPMDAHEAGVQPTHPGLAVSWALAAKAQGQQGQLRWGGQALRVGSAVSHAPSTAWPASSRIKTPRGRCFAAGPILVDCRRKPSALQLLPRRRCAAGLARPAGQRSAARPPRRRLSCNGHSCSRLGGSRLTTLAQAKALCTAPAASRLPSPVHRGTGVTRHQPTGQHTRGGGYRAEARGQNLSSAPGRWRRRSPAAARALGRRLHCQLLRGLGRGGRGRRRRLAAGALVLLVHRGERVDLRGGRRRRW